MDKNRNKRRINTDTHIVQPGFDIQISLIHRHKAEVNLLSKFINGCDTGDTGTCCKIIVTHRQMIPCQKHTNKQTI